MRACRSSRERVVRSRLRVEPSTALDEPPADVRASPRMNDVMLDRGADTERLVDHGAQPNPQRVGDVADAVEPHCRRLAGQYPTDARLGGGRPPRELPLGPADRLHGRSQGLADRRDEHRAGPTGSMRTAMHGAFIAGGAHLAVINLSDRHASASVIAARARKPGGIGGDRCAVKPPRGPHETAANSRLHRISSWPARPTPQIVGSVPQTSAPRPTLSQP